MSACNNGHHIYTMNERIAVYRWNIAISEFTTLQVSSHRHSMRGEIKCFKGDIILQTLLVILLLGFGEDLLTEGAILV